MDNSRIYLQGKEVVTPYYLNKTKEELIASKEVISLNGETLDTLIADATVKVLPRLDKLDFLIYIYGVKDETTGTVTSYNNLQGLYEIYHLTEGLASFRSVDSFIEDIAMYDTGATSIYNYRTTIDMSFDENGVTYFAKGTQGNEQLSVLETNNDYANPYIPQFDGSPTTKKYVDDSINELSSKIYEIELETVFKMSKPGNTCLIDDTDRTKFNDWLSWLSQQEGETELRLYNRYIQDGTDRHSYGMNNDRRLVKVVRISYADLLNNTHQYISFELWGGSSQSSYGKTYSKYQVTLAMRFDTTKNPVTIKDGLSWFTYDCCKLSLGDESYTNYMTDKRIDSKLETLYFEGTSDEWNALTATEQDSFLVSLVEPMAETNEDVEETLQAIFLDETPTETEDDLTEDEANIQLDRIIEGGTI